jgi:hypothetical protein
MSRPLPENEEIPQDCDPFKSQKIGVGSSEPLVVFLQTCPAPCDPAWHDLPEHEEDINNPCLATMLHNQRRGLSSSSPAMNCNFELKDDATLGWDAIRCLRVYRATSDQSIGGICWLSGFSAEGHRGSLFVNHGFSDISASSIRPYISWEQSRLNRCRKRT